MNCRKESLRLLEWVEAAAVFVAMLHCGYEYEPGETPFFEITSQMAEIGEITRWEQRQLNIIYRMTSAVQRNEQVVSPKQLRRMICFRERFNSVYSEEE